jgi:hypothetical protein
MVPSMGKMFFSSPKHPKPDVVHTTSPIQWVPRTLSPSVKQPGHEGDHSPPLLLRSRMRISISLQGMHMVNFTLTKLIYIYTPPYTYLNINFVWRQQTYMAANNYSGNKEY